MGLRAPKICSPDGRLLCYDDCDSLGHRPRYQALYLGRDLMPPTQEAFVARYPHLVDTSCYAIRTGLYRQISSRWLFGYGADCVVATTLVRRRRVACTGKYSVNYRLGSTMDVPAEYFEGGTAIMRSLYGDRFPWTQPLTARGAAGHPPLLPEDR